LLRKYIEKEVIIVENKRVGFGSKIGFILTMAAFCIGIGNLWKFPYIVGNNGGGAFLIVYLILVVLIGIPAILIETTLGRSAQLSPAAGMRALEGKKSTLWSCIGWMGTAAIFIICSYATMIVGGWSGGYIIKIINGSMRDATAEEIAGIFGSFAGSPWVIVLAAVQAILLWLCLCAGLKKGVEKVSSVLLPTLLVIMIVLAIYANTLDGAFEGLKWYLTPDFSKITLGTIAIAGMQIFYSIGIGQTGAFVYGSYISKKTNLVSSMSTTAVLDTCVAVLAGLICVPALFAFSMEPTAGPSLIFITLPQLFNEMGGFGVVFGILFMVCVYVAGFTSILGGSEAMVSSLSDSKGVDRKKAATVIVVLEFLFSILFTMSFGSGKLAQVSILNLGFFDFFDFVASFFMCLGAVAMFAYVATRWGFKKFQTEANEGATGKLRIHNWMKWYLWIVFPLVLLFIVYSIITSYF